MSIIIFFGFSIFIVMVSTVYVIVSIKNLIRLKQAKRAEIIAALDATLGERTKGALL